MINSDLASRLKATVFVQIVLLLMVAPVSESIGLVVWMVAFLTFWFGFVPILIWRRKDPTKGDLVYTEWGFLMILFIGIPIIVRMKNWF